MTIGGTVLFKKSNTKLIEQIIEEILSHKDTTITLLKAKQTKLKTNKPTEEPTMVFIFKVTIPERLSRAYFMNLEDKTKNPPVLIIKEPRVLIIKLLGNTNKTELSNEIAIHNKFGGQSNIMPFCPSFLFNEQIRFESNTMTSLGEVFYKLLLSPNHILKNKDINYGEIKVKYKVQHIIIMEFLDCKTLNELNKSKELNDSKGEKIIHSLYGNIINFDNYSNLNTFYTYFLATLMALEHYSHGDLHMDNVLICSGIITTPPTIIPLLIDFGRSAPIDDLEFQELSNKNIFDNWKSWTMNESKYHFIKEIYIEAFNHKNSIVDYIKQQLISKNYIYAIIVISMCMAINRDDIYFNKYGDSMFNFTFIPMNKDGEYDEYIYDGYLHFYNVDIPLAEKYNTLISRLLITQQNEKIKIQDLYNKKPKHVQTLKMQTIKSPTLKFSKSKTYVRVGGRHIINIKKHKCKRTKKTKKKQKSKWY